MTDEFPEWESIVYAKDVRGIPRRLYDLIKQVYDSNKASDKVFISDEQTGTGSAQNIAHGLGDTPTKVAIIPTKAPTGGFQTTYTVGSANVIVTATSTMKYVVLAFG